MKRQTCEEADTQTPNVPTQAFSNEPMEWFVNPRGHVWQEKDEEDGGGVDRSAFAEGYHNGPVCVNCGYYFCEWCRSKIDECPNAKPQEESK